MASEAASRLKKDWMEMPAECFEVLTFGEIKVGQKFISLPFPGDNSGHGGFKGAHYIFIKTHESVLKTHESVPGWRYNIPHGRALNISAGIFNDFSHSMSIIIVE